MGNRFGVRKTTSYWKSTSIKALSLILLLFCGAPTHAETLCVDSNSTADSGTATDSGGSGSNYSNNESCSLLVQPASGGDITLSFSAFRYESGFDFLRVYDGTTTAGPLLGSFTGTTVPADLTATSGSMLIVNSTDFSVTDAGFVASWSVSSGADHSVCVNSGSSSDTGALTDSGGSGGNYNNNESCGYLIQPTGGGAVTLSFSSFSYENTYDFLRVYDGTSAAGTLLGSFTGSSLPTDLVASSGAMYIVSDTDFIVTDNGFVASWSVTTGTVCSTESVGDVFNTVSFAENAGSVNWTTDWLEIAESDGAATGIARVNGSNCSAGNCLRLGEPSSTRTWSNIGVQREADLSGATAVTLSFNYFTGRTRGTESVALAVSGDGGGSWTTLQTYSITGTSFTANPESFDISAFAGANTRIRFLSSGNAATIGMYIDDIQISYQPTCGPTATAEWRFDEASWSGTAGEVADSIGNGLDGVAAGGASTVAAGQVCRAGTFDGTNDFVTVANLDDTLAGTSTLTFWLMTTQLGNDTAWLAPGITGVEEQGATDDVFWGWLNAAGQINISSGDDAGAESSTVVNDGNWHHVALTRDDTSGETQVFVNGVLEDTVVSQAGIVGNAFTAIGRVADTGSTDTFFNGLLDEVVMFDSVLTAAEIQDIFSNTSAGNSWDGQARSCPNISASALVVSHDQAGIHCLAEPVTVVAVDATNTVVTTYADQITLDTQSGRGTWSLQSGGGTLVDATANDGLATYQFAGADNGQASFLLSYPEGTTPIDVDAFQTNDTNVRDDDAEGLLAFAPSGITVTATALSNPPPLVINDPIATQIAGNNFDLHLAAYGTTATDSQCGVIETYQGSFSLKFWMNYLNPGTGSRVASVSGTSIAPNEAAAVNQTVSFVAGQAVVSANYKDAGQIRIEVKDDQTYSHTLRGASNDFVVRPAELVVTAVESLSGDANPAAADMSGAGFVPSGQNFRVTVEARDADGDVTPNYGLESTAEQIAVVSDGLVAPVGGRHGSAGGIGGGLSFTRIGPGQFRSNAVLFDEVGIVRLRAQVRDGDYLGIGAVPGPLSANVGRFYPASIVLSSASTAPACNGFVYQDQPALQLSYTLQARNALGAVVENYSTALLGSANVAAVRRSAENADAGVALDSRLSSGSATWTAGVLAEVDIAATFSRAAAADGPYDDLQLGIAIDDALDGLSVAAADQHTGSSGDCALAAICDSVAIGAPLQVRYGRLSVLPGSGSELSDLDVPLLAQYFDGTGFRAHAIDQCSQYQSGAVTLSDYQDALDAGETNLLGPLAATSVVQGAPDPNAPLLLSAPGSGNTGNVLLELAVPSWLQFDWFGSGLTDPQGRQSFGLYRGHDRVVYWSERLD